MGSNQDYRGNLIAGCAGAALGSTTVRPHTLKSAAVREFGSWPAALAAAGVEPTHYLRQRMRAQKAEKQGNWSKERVRKAILQRHAFGLPLNGNAVLRDDRRLFCAGRTWFRTGPGPWRMRGSIRPKATGIHVDVNCAGEQKAADFLAEHGVASYCPTMPAPADLPRAESMAGPG